MYMNYGISYDLANRIKKYFDYISTSKTYVSKKLTNLKKIKEMLLGAEIIKEFNFIKYQDMPVASINKMPIPGLFNSENIVRISTSETSDNQVKLFIAKDLESSCYSVFEKTVDLLETGIDISKIVIMNSSLEDDFHLQKLFNDASIPIHFNKNNKLNTYPEVIELLKIYKQFGFDPAKKYLSNLIKDESDSILIKPMLSIFNAFKNQDFLDYPALLINLINNKSIKPVKYTNCVNVYNYKDIVYEEEAYYLFMNYSDKTLPKTTHFSGYLTSEELVEIDYLSESEYNVYLENQDINFLNKILNLTLFFSEKAETKNRIAKLDLTRKIIQIEYEYQIKKDTYLNSLNQLEYSKTKYDYENFFLKQVNYTNLYNRYNKSVKEYKHEYSGILKTDLNYLLAKRNSLTGAKVEAFNLCQFQFLLKYILKLESFETNISLYLGNLSHKVLEEYIKTPDLDYCKLIDDFPGFPEEEVYKEEIFKLAIKKEMKILLPIIKEFDDITMFNDIKTELKFNIPFKHNKAYNITGTIDKVMIYQNSKNVNYIALIDYKLSDKDFDMERFEKKLQLQLPVYLYAYKNINDSKIVPAGFYYQSTSLGRYYNEPNVFMKKYQLKGLSLADKDILDKLNPGYELLKGIAVKQDGNFNKNAEKRVMSSKGFDNIYNQVELSFLDMINKLELGSFRINPLPAYGKRSDSISCEYCTFASICYNKNKNLGVIK